MQYSDNQNREELADYFARCLLMPKPRFIYEWNNLQEELITLPKMITRMSKIFICPKEQVAIRAKELRLITENTYKNQLTLKEGKLVNNNKYNMLMIVLSIAFILTAMLFCAQ